MTEKTPLILLPGLLCDAALWRHQIESIATFIRSVISTAIWIITPRASAL
jgi:hypothetical protein